jgi:hypothetical protein
VKCISSMSGYPAENMFSSHSIRVGWVICEREFFRDEGQWAHFQRCSDGGYRPVGRNERLQIPTSLDSTGHSSLI